MKSEFEDELEPIVEVEDRAEEILLFNGEYTHGSQNEDSTSLIQNDETPQIYNNSLLVNNSKPGLDLINPISAEINYVQNDEFLAGPQVGLTELTIKQILATTPLLASETENSENQVSKSTEMNEESDGNSFSQAHVKKEHPLPLNSEDEESSTNILDNAETPILESNLTLPAFNKTIIVVNKLVQEPKNHQEEMIPTKDEDVEVEIEDGVKRGQSLELIQEKPTLEKNEVEVEVEVQANEAESDKGEEIIDVIVDIDPVEVLENKTEEQNQSKHEDLKDNPQSFFDNDHPCLTLSFKDTKFQVFYPQQENVLFTNKLHLYRAPIGLFATCLQTHFQITNDITLEFPELKLRFPTHMIFAQSVSLFQLYLLTRGLRNKTNQPIPFCVLVKEEPVSFVAQYNHLINYTKEGSLFPSPTCSPSPFVLENKENHSSDQHLERVVLLPTREDESVVIEDSGSWALANDQGANSIYQDEVEVDIIDILGEPPTDHNDINSFDFQMIQSPKPKRRRTNTLPDTYTALPLSFKS